MRYLGRFRMRYIPTLLMGLILTLEDGMSRKNTEVETVDFS